MLNRGSVESQNHAYNLITTIIREDGGDQDVQTIITRSLAMNQLNERPKNQQKPSHVQIIAAPIPTKSAWKVPPATSSKSVSLICHVTFVGIIYKRTFCCRLLLG